MHKALTSIIRGFHNAMRLLVVICTVIAMFTLTTYWRNEFNGHDSYVEQRRQKSNRGEKVTLSQAEFDLRQDEEAARNLYRKIWTYDALIFLSGALLLYLVNPNGKKLERKGIQMQI